MDWIYYICLLVVLILGLVVNILGLPGLWLMVLGYIAYAWVTKWVFVGWPSLIVVVVLALLAEAVEFFAGAAGSKAAGGRTRGMIGAVVGGFLGGVFLTVLLPIPVGGTIVGACAGAFIGAGGVEVTGKENPPSLPVRGGAAQGRVVGI